MNSMVAATLAPAPKDDTGSSLPTSQQLVPLFSLLSPLHYLPVGLLCHFLKPLDFCLCFPLVNNRLNSSSSLGRLLVLHFLLNSSGGFLGFVLSFALLVGGEPGRGSKCFPWGVPLLS